jgi:membrane protein
MINLKIFLRLLIESLQGWLRSQGRRHAGALAFFTIFSLTPLVVLTVGIAEIVFYQAAIADEIVNLTEEVVGRQVATLITEIIKNDDFVGCRCCSS